MIKGGTKDVSRKARDGCLDRAPPLPREGQGGSVTLFFQFPIPERPCYRTPENR
jgi:hypothetical protein